ILNLRSFFGRKTDMKTELTQVMLQSVEGLGFPRVNLKVSLPSLWTKLYTQWLRLTFAFASIGKKLSIHYSSEISRCVASCISLGNGVSIGKHAWLTLGMQGEHEIKIMIGDSCHIDDRCSITSKNFVCLER